MAEAPQPSMRLKFWGVRGSIPVPGDSTLGYGGNTTCVEIRAHDQIILLDAGTGIRRLGLDLEKEFGRAPINLTLLVTHPHWDHIHGLPFFVPAHEKDNNVIVFGPDTAVAGLREILEGQMSLPFFPVALYELPGKIDIRKLTAREFTLGQVHVRWSPVNHPANCVGYRLFANDRSIAFLPDHEPYDFLHSAHGQSLPPAETRKRAEDERQGLVEFLHGCDVLILDAQYTDEEYRARVGWGHGSLGSALALARDANVRKLVLFHHDPSHDDAKIDKMLNQARALANNAGAQLEIEAAREGAELTL
jgi:phosphoribosyl 1,2-cyclic phosphodiesterase